METMINYEVNAESAFVNAFATVERSRIKTLTNLLDLERNWLDETVKNRQFSQSELAMFSDNNLPLSMAVLRGLYELQEHANGSKYLASVLATDYFDDLTNKFNASRYLVYQEYLDKVVENPETNKVFSNILRFRIKEEKLITEIKDPKLSEQEREYKREELQRVFSQRLKYQKDQIEESKYPLCPEARKYRQQGIAIPKDHIHKCSLCEEQERKLLITGKKVTK